MKKRYKLLTKTDSIFILHWVTEGVLFGPEWLSIAKFANNAPNLDRCKQIIRLMNDCDKTSNENKDDRERY